MELSVIIVSFNVREYLSGCLHSVLNASAEIESEIFVIDNNSSDGSAEMVRDEFPSISLICNKVNTGFAVANNQAIKKAEGRFILLLNPDTIVKEDTFSKCIGFMSDHPDAGALGVRMVNGEEKFLPESKRALPNPSVAFFKISGLSYLFSGSRILNRYYLPEIDSYETSGTEVISGAFMFIRKDTLVKSGPLDERFFMYGEDIDLSYRLLQTGYNNYYFPEVQIVHFKGKSTGSKNFTDIFHFYRAMKIYVKKRHNEKFSIMYYIIVPAIYIREGIALCYRFLRIILHR